MNCPNCSTLCDDADCFCRVCGASLRKAAPQQGSMRVPLLLLVMMSVIGLVLFFLTT